MVKITKREELDVDVRFLLANERTLLAWIRTSLAIQAGGIALAALHAHNPYLGVAILVFGVVVAVMGYQRYRIADKSIRAGELPPTGIGPVLQVYAIVVIAIVLAVAQLTLYR